MKRIPTALVGFLLVSCFLQAQDKHVLRVLYLNGHKAAVPLTSDDALVRNWFGWMQGEKRLRVPYSI